MTPYSRPLILILLTIVLTITHLTTAQRDLTAIKEENEYTLSVYDKNGRALTIAGLDPLKDKPKHPAMCYTTPWNPSGYKEASDTAIRRLQYVAPTWFTLHLNVTKSGESGKSQLSVRITGHKDVDIPFLRKIHTERIARRYVPKVVPRVSLQLSQQAISLLLNPATHVNIIESLLDLVHTGGLPLVGVYKGYDGLTLEMPSIWNYLPPYPNSILTFTDPDTSARKDASRAAVDPNNVNWDPDDPRQRAAGNDYGSYKYDFTATDLQTHPRHIINTFVRKLGTALQAFDKSLLLVAAPYRHDDPQRDQSETINTAQAMDEPHSLHCAPPSQTTFPKAFSHVDAYYLSPYVDYFNVMTYDFSPLSLKDLNHVQSIENQVRTVATTRVGYTAKRMWRIFHGKSSIYEDMFLEDFIRQQQESDDHPDNKQLVASLQAEIDALEDKIKQDVDANVMKRLLPQIDWPLCFNVNDPNIYDSYNDFTQLCFVDAEPNQWYHSLDLQRSRRTHYSPGVNNEAPGEEESTDGNYAQMKTDTWKELTDSIQLHNKKLMQEFRLDPDQPWPKLSYGWSISPVPWIRNGILAVTIPFQCTKQLFSSWDSKGETVTLKRILTLKNTLPRTTISRDVVVPIKLEKITAKFDVTASLQDYKLLNSTLSSLCAAPIDSLNSEMQAACDKHHSLLQKQDELDQQRRSKTVKRDDDSPESSILNAKINFEPSEHQLDWTFPTIKLDSHIQHRIDSNPKYNQVRVLSGMNWYGYLYKSRDPLAPKDQDDGVTFSDPIAVTAAQAEEYVNKWKGQIDIKHDLSSGDRFFVFRDGPGNNAVSALWYPSYTQLHRKLYQMRALSDGVAIWECGQGLGEFDKLI